MGASLAHLQETPGRLHGEIAWVWGRSCSCQWKIRVPALAGWTVVDGVRVRPGIGRLGGSSCFKMRGVLTFYSPGGLSF